MYKRQERASNTRGVVISCIISAALIAIIAAMISFTSPRFTDPIALTGPSFDYFGKQKAATARYAEIDNRIAKEARLSAEAARAPSDSGETAPSGTPPLRISTNLYEFDLPEYWQDRVDVVYGSRDSVSIYAKGLPDAPLAAVTVSRSTAAIETSYTDSSLVYSRSNQKGQRIELWMTDFVRIVFSENREGAAEPEGWQAKLLDPATAKKVVALQALGKTTANDVLSAAQADKEKTAVLSNWDNAVNAIISTISIK